MTRKVGQHTGLRDVFFDVGKSYRPHRYSMSRDESERGAEASNTIDARWKRSAHRRSKAHKPTLPHFDCMDVSPAPEGDK